MATLPVRAPHPTRTSLRALEASNFFLADVQTGLGPFVAAYLVASHWSPSMALYALTPAVRMSLSSHQSKIAGPHQCHGRQVIAATPLAWMQKATDA